MRARINRNPRLDIMPIEELRVNLKSRDDIPRVIRALQEIYVNEPVREELLALLDAYISPDKRRDWGRPGMSLWRIFVLALFKQALDCDYDRLVNLANEHASLKVMLQFSDWHERPFELQTVIDNVSLVTPELWRKVNDVIVGVGLKVVGKKSGPDLKARCDSFVVETDVDYPTDMKLLFDAMRKAVNRAVGVANAYDFGGWRQSKSLKSKLGQAFQAVRVSKRRKAYPDIVMAYLNRCGLLLAKCEDTRAEVVSRDPSSWRLAALEETQREARRHFHLVWRRLVNNETIPHHEKVFSLHAPHTRWIKKGKAGVPVELGVPLAIVESHEGLILDWEIMWKGTDVDVLKPLTQRCTMRYPTLNQISCDKGFWSPENYEALSNLIDHPVLPKKGKPNKTEKARQSTAEFREARRLHSAVESRINCLEHHGCSRIRTKGGPIGFARTVAASIVATNLCQIGTKLLLQDRERYRRAA